jgi:hypothetical protein
MQQGKLTVGSSCNNAYSILFSFTPPSLPAHPATQIHAVRVMMKSRAMIAESAILALPATTLSHLAWQYIHDLQLEVLIPLHFDLIPTGYTVVTNNLAPSSIVLRHRLQPVHPNPRSWRAYCTG